MSHSTTGTSSYILTKYSRSYPVKRTLQKAQIGSQRGPETAQEWQHFTNPTIRLVLDVKTSSIGEAQSVRLRILWQMDVELNQPDVSFEDLDLLSFGSVAPSVPRTQQTEVLPLKAVYHDTVVGIRYFHNREDDGVPVYRRFQISFQSLSEAAEFIEMIKPVCICKMNPITPAQSGTAPQTQVPIRRPTVRPQQPNFAASKTLLPNRGPPYTHPSFANSKCTPPVRKELVQTPQHNQQPPSLVTSLALSSSPPSHLPISDPLFNSSSSPPPPSTGRLLTLSSQPSINIKDIPTHNSEQRPSRICEHSAPTLDNTMPIATHLPSSSIPSLPSSINSVNILEPRPVIEPVGHEETRHSFLASMGEITSIYALSNTALEQVIGEVIREDGFVQLLEKISEMWTIKTVAGI